MGHAHSEHGPTAHDGASHGNLKSYAIGFILSIILTVIPFWMVMSHGFSHSAILWTICVMAIVQVFVHVYYFLHMNGAPEQRWNEIAFGFTLMVAVLLIGGSVWIMANVVGNMMPTQVVPPLTEQR